MLACLECSLRLGPGILACRGSRRPLRYATAGTAEPWLAYRLAPAALFPPPLRSGAAACLGSASGGHFEGPLAAQDAFASSSRHFQPKTPIRRRRPPDDVGGAGERSEQGPPSARRTFAASSRQFPLTIDQPQTTIEPLGVHHDVSLQLAAWLSAANAAPNAYGAESPAKVPQIDSQAQTHTAQKKGLTRTGSVLP